MKSKIFLLLLTFFIVGCNNQPQNYNTQNLPSIEVDINENQEHSICLNGMKGEYPDSIKDKKLGEGLLNNEYKKMIDIILSNLKEDTNLKIIFTSKNKDEDIKKIIKEMKLYFNKNPKFLIVFNKAAYPDVKIEIVKDKSTDIINFIIYFENKQIFIEKAPKFIKLSSSLKELQKEAMSEWSRVEIPTNDGGKAIYYIMKRPVLVSEFFKRNTKIAKAATSVSFDEADNYCFKKGGSISTLYVFEYALRKGLIIPPTKYGVSEEFVAPFDPANDEDRRLKLPGDVVFLEKNECEKILDKTKRDVCYAKNMDYSTVYVFDFRDYKYEKASQEGNMNITFRCIKKGE